MKVEVKLNGKAVKVYDFERYDLWKSGKVKVSGDVEKDYKERLEAENNKPNRKKIIGNTQYQVLSNRITQLENKVQELSKASPKEEKRKPVTKEKKNNTKTK